MPRTFDLILAAPSGTTPGAPSQVSAIAKDGAATVSFLAPASQGSSSITGYTVTPYVGGSAQTSTSFSVGSLGTIAASSGSTFYQASITGLTNSTAYTFTAKATNSNGTGPESSQSGANTPRSKLIWGDEFNGPNGQAPDPEWYVYNRCGYLGQSETEWYKPSHCVLDGSGNLQLIGTFAPVTGGGGPQNGNATVTQNWTSGACQNNTKSFAPGADGNTLTIETRFKVPTAINGNWTTNGGMWPGLLWCEGTDYQTQWKTDPTQSMWNTTGKWEWDLAEFGSTGETGGGTTSSCLHNISGGSGFVPDPHTGTSLGFDASAGFHVYSGTWKGTATVANRAVNWYTDAPYVQGTGPSGGTQLSGHSGASDIAQQTNPIFLNLYLQILNSATSDPGLGNQICYIDYVRVYDELI